MTGHIRHAVIGCGRVAPLHAYGFARRSEVELAYACDIDLDLAKEFASRYGFTRAVRHFEDVLDDETVTSLSLAVPHHLHGPMMLEAVRRGKHVLVEKPLVLDPEQGFEAIAVAREVGAIILPVTQHRFDPLIDYVWKILQERELGDLHMVRAHLECLRTSDYYSESPWRGRWNTEGGSVLINQAYHLVDLLLWLVGPVERATASLATLGHSAVMETEDVLAATFSYDCGALGSLTINGASGSQWGSYIELVGGRGALAFDIDYPNRLHRLEFSHPSSQEKWKKRFDALALSDSPPAPGVSYYGNSHRYQVEAFLYCIQGKHDVKAATPDQALDTIRFIRALYREGLVSDHDNGMFPF